MRKSFIACIALSILSLTAFAQNEATARRKTFAQDSSSIKKTMTAKEVARLKAACKASEAFAAQGQLMYSLFDIDYDGEAEIFLKDAEDNKAVAVKKGKGYEVYSLGIFKSYITLMPSLISVSTSAGTGVSIHALYAFKDSDCTMKVARVSEAAWGSDEVKERYDMGTKEQYDILVERMDKVNQIYFEDLSWRQF